MKNKLRYSTLVTGMLLAFNANAMEEGFNFHGYAKEGIAMTNDAKLNPGKYEWANTGANQFSLPGNIFYTNTSGGRLGNEPNWLELHFDYGFAEQNGMNWGVKTNITSAGGHKDINMDEFYVLADGVITSNPSATFWAGKRYYGRVDTFLTDSQAMSSDGHGAGIDNVDVGFGKLNFGVTLPYDAEHKTDEDGYLYAFSSSLKDIEVADKLKMDLYANFGTFFGPGNDDNSEVVDDKYPNNYQVAAKLRFGDWNSYDEFFIRYSSKVANSITRNWEHSPDTQIGGFLQGYKEGGPFRFSYIWQFEIADYDEDARTRSGTPDLAKNTWNSLVARVSYPWNERTTTEIETGYEFVDFEATDSANDGQNEGYKVTLSQNLHINSGFWDRPVIRFYVTHASQDVENVSIYGWQGGDAPLGKNDALSVGVQFETWW